MGMNWSIEVIPELAERILYKYRNSWVNPASSHVNTLYPKQQTPSGRCRLDIDRYLIYADPKVFAIWDIAVYRKISLQGLMK